MLDTLLLSLLLTTLQLFAASEDSYTTELCFEQGNRTGLHIYEENPLYTIPFGRQPSLTEFVVSDLVSIAAMYAIGYLIRKTPARDWWFVPQVALIGAQTWQSKSNWNLYKRLKNE